MTPFQKHLKCVKVIKLLFAVKIRLKPYYYSTFQKALRWNVTDSSFLFFSTKKSRAILILWIIWGNWIATLYATAEPMSIGFSLFSLCAVLTKLEMLINWNNFLFWLSMAVHLQLNLQCYLKFECILLHDWLTTMTIYIFFTYLPTYF